MPSRSWIQAACSKYGPRTRVVMNPGTSFLTTTTVLPNDFARSTAAWSVASLVVSARTTSTSGISIGGLKKCIPTTFFGRFVPQADVVSVEGGQLRDSVAHLPRADDRDPQSRAAPSGGWARRH